MKVSVLISAYNAEKYIEETIESILNQTYRNFEVLIADDASTDNTKRLIEKFEDKRIRKFYNSNNLNKPRTIQKLFSTRMRE
jgi:glycosyltransferase involved in cell wall biosynthesis